MQSSASELTARVSFNIYLCVWERVYILSFLLTLSFRSFYVEEMETLQVLDNWVCQAKELESKLVDEKKACMRNLQDMLSLFDKNKEQ